jgi:membrane fusion protein (multidrug efflux system)
MTETGKKNKKPAVMIIKIVLIVIIIAGAAIIVFNLLPHGQSDDFPKGPPMPGAINIADNSSRDVISVNVVKAEKSSIDEYIKTNGDIISRKNVNIYPDTSGKLVRLHVSLGDFVQKNQVIGEVDPSKPGSVYTHNYVKSPISGTITGLPTDIGSTVTTQTPIAAVGDLGNIVIQSFISERFVSKIKIGQLLFFSLEAYPGVTFTAKIVEKSPILDRESRTLEIWAKPEPPDSRIQAGMFPSIKLITQHKENVIVVPKECIVHSHTSSWVFVVMENNTARKKMVKTGLESDGMVEITAGLDIGDVIVTRGQYALSDGVSVNIIE